MKYTSVNIWIYDNSILEWCSQDLLKIIMFGMTALVKKRTRDCSSAEKCQFLPCFAIFFSATLCSATFFSAESINT
jgi:hypothetical protein